MSCSDVMATNYVGRLIHETRLARSMTFGDVARSCGAVTPKQTSRIAQRIVLFEREGVRDLRLLRRVVVALAVDLDQVNELLRRQREEELAEWNAWADELVPMELHMRPFAGVWFKLPLPVEVENQEQAIEHARQMTVGREELRVVLAVNRRRSITFARGEVIAVGEATPGRSLTPHVEIGGKRIVFEARDREEGTR